MLDESLWHDEICSQWCHVYLYGTKYFPTIVEKLTDKEIIIWLQDMDLSQTAVFLCCGEIGGPPTGITRYRKDSKSDLVTLCDWNLIPANKMGTVEWIFNKYNLSVRLVISENNQPLSEEKLKLIKYVTSRYNIEEDKLVAMSTPKQ